MPSLIFARSEESCRYCRLLFILADIQPPQIQCPSNIEVDAETNKSYATVNWTVPVPTDNSNTTMKAIGLYPAQKIEAGRTEITYNVTDSAGLSAHCRFTVYVKGNCNCNLFLLDYLQLH